MIAQDQPVPRKSFNAVTDVVSASGKGVMEGRTAPMERMNFSAVSRGLDFDHFKNHF